MDQLDYILTVIGKGDKQKAWKMLQILAAYIQVARVKYPAESRGAARTHLYSEWHELSSAMLGSHDHAIESEIMDMLTILVRMWNEEYENDNTRS